MSIITAAIQLLLAPQLMPLKITPGGSSCLRRTAYSKVCTADAIFTLESQSRATTADQRRDYGLGLVMNRLDRQRAFQKKNNKARYMAMNLRAKNVVGAKNKKQQNFFADRRR